MPRKFVALVTLEFEDRVLMSEVKEYIRSWVSCGVGSMDSEDPMTSLIKKSVKVEIEKAET